MKELLIMAKSLGGGGSEVALIELINALPEELYNITLVLLDSDNEYAYIEKMITEYQFLLRILKRILRVIRQLAQCVNTQVLAE